MLASPDQANIWGGLVTVTVLREGRSHYRRGPANGISGAVVLPLLVCALEDEFATCFAGVCWVPLVFAWNSGTDELVFCVEIAIWIDLSNKDGALEWLH